MARIVFDIETLGADFDTLDTPVKDYFLRFQKTDEEIKEIKESMSFYPLTAEIIAIGMLNPDTDKGAVFFQSDKPFLPLEEDGIRYESGSEKEILEKFWQTIKNYGEIVTFNGRAFDCPFIYVRSAMHKIKPTKDLIPGRYTDSHIDLFDRLSFYGAVRKKFSLDMWCRAFGIESPKDEFTGYEVKEIYKAGRFLDIAKYCARDIRATKELFSYWDNYIRPH